MSNTETLATEILAAPVGPSVDLQDSTPSSRPGSNTSYIAGLDLGRSFIYNAEVPGETPIAAVPAATVAAKRKVRDNINAAVGRASKLTGYRYTTSVDDVMIANRMFVVALVTRIE